MLRPALTAVIAMTAFLTAATAQPAGDLKALAGKWAVVKAELGGKDFTAAFKEVELLIAPDGGYKVTVGKQIDEGVTTTDATKTPKEMDIIGKVGPNAGKTHKTIYKLDGDTLTVCYELGGGPRPTAFKTTAGSKLFLAEYKRTK